MSKISDTTCQILSNYTPSYLFWGTFYRDTVSL